MSLCTGSDNPGKVNNPTGASGYSGSLDRVCDAPFAVSQQGCESDFINGVFLCASSTAVCRGRCLPLFAHFIPEEESQTTEDSSQSLFVLPLWAASVFQCQQLIKSLSWDILRRFNGLQHPNPPSCNRYSLLVIISQRNVQRSSWQSGVIVMLHRGSSEADWCR